MWFIFHVSLIFYLFAYLHMVVCILFSGWNEEYLPKGSLLYLSCPSYIPLTFQKISSSKSDRKISTVACYVFPRLWNIFVDSVCLMGDSSCVMQGGWRVFVLYFVLEFCYWILSSVYLRMKTCRHCYWGFLLCIYFF